jgi:hypothetical protein
LNIPTNIPENKAKLLQQVIERLSSIPNLEAIVLGGSYASGTQNAGSDLDIGLYYFETTPFSIEDIRQAANATARPGTTPTVTGFYEWGAWVNGGAWVETVAGKMDFLYRNLDHVRRTIQEAQAGICRHDYDQQPANGYYSTGYLAETRICVPLYDPASRIVDLKKEIQDYPVKLKQRIIADSLWSAEFTLIHARGFAEKGDIYNTTGCLVRMAASLTQAIFAINEEFFLSDKKALEKINSFKIVPPAYVEKVLSILSHPGAEPLELRRSVEQMENAWQSIRTLTGK